MWVLTHHDMANKMTKRLFLSDPDVSAEFVGALHEAAKSIPIAIEVNKLVTLTQEFVAQFTRADELQQAVQQTLSDSGFDEGAVVEFLRARNKEMVKAVAEVITEKRSLEMQLLARQAEVSSVLNPAVRDLGSLPKEVERLRALVKGYAAARDETLRSYKVAGLSDANIQAIGLVPTPDDLAGWKGQIEQHGARLHRIRAFLASAPIYDVSILEDETGEVSSN